MGDISPDMTTLATGDSSHESIDALRFGAMKPQRKKMIIVLLSMLIGLVFLIGAGIGIWQIIAKSAQQSNVLEDPVCIGHVTKTINNKVFVMNQPTEASVVTFTGVYDSSWTMKPAWRLQDGKLVTATGLIMTYNVAEDNFTLEKESESTWQPRWQISMDITTSGKGILHTTDPNGRKKYLQVRTEQITLSSDRKLACLADTDEAFAGDTPVYANQICRVSDQPSTTPISNNPTDYDDASSCEKAHFKWGTPNPGEGLGIQLQRCYRPQWH